MQLVLTHCGAAQLDVTARSPGVDRVVWCRSEALEPDVVAYNITVRALVLSGNLQAAVDTLAQLMSSRHQARPASFLPLLAATAASGSVRSVLELWVQMQRLNVTPDVSCMRAFALASLRSGNPGAPPLPLPKFFCLL